ncbi:uncharacterized protein BDR25DRAFT_360310 [Lindgomyces ingoldianus]|uniref:Uncharacterized protein n=1 Tax=Lindgomyces ingoldianus TaxID=673940 RepID=A0ACB6QFW5_9PLEO|nr:uncharacterized protein BDR25DRAFT_360310 [Lindgomyces ingoldianus]KAF2465782.1 hypothetical protein BDR25DRAFT_360310 [Lindgomyces ingoldianus]
MVLLGFALSNLNATIVKKETTPSLLKSTATDDFQRHKANTLVSLTTTQPSVDNTTIFLAPVCPQDNNQPPARPPNATFQDPSVISASPEGLHTKDHSTNSFHQQTVRESATQDLTVDALAAHEVETANNHTIEAARAAARVVRIQNAALELNFELPRESCETEKWELSEWLMVRVDQEAIYKIHDVFMNLCQLAICDICENRCLHVGCVMKLITDLGCQGLLAAQYALIRKLAGGLEGGGDVSHTDTISEIGSSYLPSAKTHIFLKYDKLLIKTALYITVIPPNTSRPSKKGTKGRNLLSITHTGSSSRQDHMVENVSTARSLKPYPNILTRIKNGAQNEDPNWNVAATNTVIVSRWGGTEPLCRTYLTRYYTHVLRYSLIRTSSFLVQPYNTVVQFTLFGSQYLVDSPTLCPLSQLMRDLVLRRIFGCIYCN